MVETADQVAVAALALPPDSRARLVDRLIESLDTDAREAIDALWADEAEDRLAAFKRGEIEAIPGPEVMRDLRCRKLQ